ncbi:MAG: hypothetical protein NC820_07580 [Candidatus Omnitrophica bacterium]|nr:hypothetical protein [Candidatus Omnitrophota bacterium]
MAIEIELLNEGGDAYKVFEDGKYIGTYTVNTVEKDKEFYRKQIVLAEDMLSDAEDEVKMKVNESIETLNRAIKRCDEILSLIKK